MKKRILACMIAIIMLLSALPLTASAASIVSSPKGSDFTDNAVIAERIDAVLAAYRPGVDYFTKNKKACTTCHNDNSFLCKNSPSKCNCLRKVTINGKKVDLQAVQCFGYSMYWQQILFGKTEKSAASKFKKLGAVSSLTATKVKNWFVNNSEVLHPGAHIRVKLGKNNYHSITVLGVNYDKGTVTFAQCNWTDQSNYNENLCKVNKITTYTWKEFASNFKNISYATVYKNYNTEFPGGSSLTVSYNANGGSIPEAVLLGESYKVTTSSGLNVRASASTSSSVLGTIAKNTAVTVTEKKKLSDYTWGKITYKGQSGWIALDSSFVSKTGDVWSETYYVSDGMIYKKSSSALYSAKYAEGRTVSGGLPAASAFDLTREGYTFKGWSNTPTGESVILPETAFLPESIAPQLANGNQSVTLYAVWVKDTPTVTDTTVEKIFITSIPQKDVYYVGDTVSISEITVTVLRNDGSFEEISEGFTCEGAVISAEGEQTVVVSYQGKSASFTVNATAKKTRANNSTAKKASVGYLLPDSSAMTVKGQGSAKSDSMQVLCRDGDYYLTLIPWGASSTTATNGVLMYIAVSDVELKSEVPDANEFYSMNPSGVENATVNTSAKVYFKPDGGKNPIKYGGVQIEENKVSAGERVKVLFELDGYYCIQTESFTGFADKSVIDLDATVCGIEAEKSEIALDLGEQITAASLSVFATMTNGTRAKSDEHKVVSYNTDKVGEGYAVVTVGDLSKLIKVTVTDPGVTELLVESLPDKVYYTVGESFDPTGMMLSAIYSDGEVEYVTDKATYKYDFSESGNSFVQIVVGDKSIYLPVTVYEAPCVAIGDVEADSGVIGVPVTYICTDANIAPVGFDAKITFDASLMRPVISEDDGVENGYLTVEQSAVGELTVTYSGELPIPDDCTLFTLYFEINESEFEGAGIAEIEFKEFVLFDSLGNTIAVDCVDGFVTDTSADSETGDSECATQTEDSESFIEPEESESTSQAQPDGSTSIEEGEMTESQTESQTENQTENQTEKGDRAGCGSTVGGMSIMLVTLLGAAVIIGKKKSEK